MEHLISELLEAVAQHAAILNSCTEETLRTRPAPGKWSKKEILGHLVDSAQNNIQRFVRSQHEDHTVHITYRQDDWVALQHYQEYPGADLIQLWMLLNRHLAHIWSHIKEPAWAVTVDIGKNAAEYVTLEALAVDYVRHLRHHLRQIDAF